MANPDVVFDTTRVQQWGRIGWSTVGIALAGAIVYSATAALSGLVIPLVIAAVIGVLGVPVVDILERLRIPRPAGAVLFVVGLFVLVGGAVALAVSGVVEQSDEVSIQIAAAVDTIGGWLAELDINLASGQSIVDGGSSTGSSLLSGAAGYLSSIFSSALSFLVGTFLAVFMLYYILVDWQQIRTWVGGHLNVPEDLGATIIDDSTSIVRQGFYALTLSSLAVATLISITMVLLDIPLAFTVGLVTFVTSYIPYLGATLSGAFGFLVALGASGLEDALILLAVILVVQNVVQTVLGNQLTSDRLSIHPLASLLATLIGATLAGLLGAMLSALVLAMIIAISHRIADASADLDRDRLAVDPISP